MKQLTKIAAAEIQDQTGLFLVFFCQMYDTAGGMYDYEASFHTLLEAVTYCTQHTTEEGLLSPSSMIRGSVLRYGNFHVAEYTEKDMLVPRFEYQYAYGENGEEDCFQWFVIYESE